MTRGLLIVDLQVDFCEGGALGVNGGNAVADNIATLLEARPGLYTHVFASQDWHNALPDLNGGHFAPQGEDPDFVDTWPVHCVAGTLGAAFHPRIQYALDNADDQAIGSVTVIRKGQGRPDYSAFQGTSIPPVNRPLASEIFKQRITSLDVVGIATDHCVRASALDALQRANGLREVRVIEDLVAGVDSVASQSALVEIVKNGGDVMSSLYL